MFRKITTVAGIAVVALTGCSAETVTFATDKGFEATVPAGTMDPCKFDDGTGAPCVWIADEQEDKDGTSFVVLEDYDGPMGRVTHDQARALSK